MGDRSVDTAISRGSPANNSVPNTLRLPQMAGKAMESVMKAKYAKYSLCICVMLASGSAFAQHVCSRSVFRGEYTFKDSGTILGVGQYGSAGALSADGKGAGVID